MPQTQTPALRKAATHGISYRPASNADTPMLSRIYASTRMDEVARTGWDQTQINDFLQMQFEAQDVHYKTHYPDALWLLIVKGIIPVGRLYIEDWTREVRIIDIALLPEFRGGGLGEAILRDIMDDAASRGLAVSIHVEKQNPAMRLYKRLGFHAAADKGVYDLLEWRAA